MARHLSIELSDREFERLDRAVSEGEFESHEAAVRAALQGVLSRTSDAELEHAYRRAYGAVPEEKVWGEVGLRLVADRVRRGEPPQVR